MLTCLAPQCLKLSGQNEVYRQLGGAVVELECVEVEFGVCACARVCVFVCVAQFRLETVGLPTDQQSSAR